MPAEDEVPGARGTTMPVGLQRFARLRSRVVVALSAAAALAAGCGDEGKVGSKDAPVSAPGATPLSTPIPAPADPASKPPPPPPPPSPGSPAPAAGNSDVRVGDWVTWEIKVDGAPTKTTLTWRATAVEGERVRIRVESATSDKTGNPVSSTTAEEWIPTPRMPAVEPVHETLIAKKVVVNGRMIETTAWASEGTGTGYASEVPLGGLAWSRAASGVEQTVVGFGRGP